MLLPLGEVTVNKDQIVTTGMETANAIEETKGQERVQIIVMVRPNGTPMGKKAIFMKSPLKCFMNQPGSRNLEVGIKSRFSGQVETGMQNRNRKVTERSLLVKRENQNNHGRIAR